MSKTYSGILVSVLGFIFAKAGVPFLAGNAEVAVEFIFVLGGALFALYGRFRAGGITILGARVK